MVIIENIILDSYVIGETIFWETNKSEPKNKGYIWSNLLNSNWFKIKI